MKKILLSVLIIFLLFLYGAYKSLRSQGWTFSSPAAEEQRIPLEEVSVITSTPILFTGDIMLGRYVETLSKRYDNDLFMFASTSEYLKSRITIANLEGPIPTVHEPTPINGFSFSFSSSTPSILKRAGVVAVSLANNHMFDKGRLGYEATKKALDAGGIAHFGGYVPTADDYFETKLGTTTVIVYGITMIATGWDEAQALLITKKLRAEHPKAYLVAFLHWGDEYATQNIYQRAFAHSLIDLGTDAIIGSHPHVVQGIEVYKAKPIFYSLGNFIFDQYSNQDTQGGYMIELSSEAKSYLYKIIPIDSVRSVPGFATSTARDRIMTRIVDQSEAALKSSIKAGELHINK